jgi:hypothetical protein
MLKEFQDQNPSIDWLWLTKCFSGENVESGLSHRFFTTTGARSLVSIGSFRHGKLCDISMEIYLDGSTYYFGQFQDGKLHGKGSILWEGGATYQGDWVNGHREGYGTYQWANGDRYQGGFKHDGKKEGKGIFTYADGDRFQGYYKNDEREGWGRMEWKASQFFFEGMFAHNEPLDQIAPLHPDIKRALDRQTCTGSVTGRSLDFGQFFYECELADYCSACVHSCAKDSVKAIRRWSDGTYCHCIDKGCCARSAEPPAKKVRNTL